jgi:hypothetical protein
VPKVAGSIGVNISSVVFSQGDCAYGYPLSVLHQKVMVSGYPVTAEVAIPAGGSFQLSFNPSLFVRAGDTISVFNGDTSGYSCNTNFFVQFL